jgi:hypothetical protein
MCGYSLSGTGLERLTLPSSVEVIGAGCFSGCRSLESPSFESGLNLQRIEKHAFQRNRASKFRHSDHQPLIQSETAAHFVVRGAMVEDTSGGALFLCFGRSVSVVIPRSVETIKVGSFRENQALEIIVFEAESCLQSIEAGSFASGKLKGILQCFREV